LDTVSYSYLLHEWALYCVIFPLGWERSLIRWITCHSNFSSYKTNLQRKSHMKVLCVSKCIWDSRSWCSLILFIEIITQSGPPCVCEMRACPTRRSTWINFSSAKFLSYYVSLFQYRRGSWKIETFKNQTYNCMFVNKIMCIHREKKPHHSSR
jgi:hypothetical protein